MSPLELLIAVPPVLNILTLLFSCERGPLTCAHHDLPLLSAAFHVTCAQQAGMHMKVDAVRETSSTGTSFIVRKAAYCDIHTPVDSDAVGLQRDHS